MSTNEVSRRPNLAGSKTLLGWPKDVPYGILREEEGEATGDAETFEYVMRYLRLSSGVYRTTYRGRFLSLDPVVNEELCRRFDSSSRLRVRDWGCSDGLVSVEWATSLAQTHRHLDFVTSDLTMYLVEASRGDARWYLEPDGTALQYTNRTTVVSLRKRPSILYPLNILIAMRAGRTANRELYPMVRALKWDRPYGCAPQRYAEWEFRQVSLLHPETRRFEQSNRWFGVEAHSVFSPEAEPCHVLRCMNLLNSNYFTDETLHQAALVAWNSLVMGGLWIVGRTAIDDRRQQDVTIFERTETGFRVVRSIGGGADLERVLAAIPLKVR